MISRSFYYLFRFAKQLSNINKYTNTKTNIVICSIEIASLQQMHLGSNENSHVYTEALDTSINIGTREIYHRLILSTLGRFIAF